MNKLEISKKKLTFKGHSDSVTAIAFTPDGKTVISGSDDKTIKTWDLETGEIKMTLEGHS
ncbi:MAG: WD40 repeat domain-containing protein, partial [Dolichospermum sp.]